MTSSSTSPNTNSSPKRTLTKGFNGFENIKSARQQVHDNWDKVSKSDKYSTGLPLLDSYLGGGFGIEGAGEVILIHSTSKTFKSTMSMQLMKTQLENGIKVGWIILEGGLWRALRNLRQLYAPVQTPSGIVGYERYDNMEANLDNLIFAMTDEMKQNNFKMDEVILWMKKARLEQGVELFLIDPIGYLSDYSDDWKTPDYKKESKFMKDLVNFADATGSTIIALQHNTKGNETSLNQTHHEAAIGGSQSFSKSPTKVIEMRNEGWLNDDPNAGRLLSLEMYMARDVRDWRGQPVLIGMNFHPDGKGKFFSMCKYEEGSAPLRGKDKRELWFGQYKKDGESALEELLEDV